MESRAKASSAVLVILCVLCVAAAAPRVAAQEQTPAVSPVAELRRAANTERGARRKALVEAIGQASPDVAAQLRQELVSAVSGALSATDTAFVIHCILALGEVKAQEATDALVAALGHPNGAVAYAAAEALGVIWEGSGASNPAAQPINVALLGAAYGCGATPALYGPALALVRINGLGPVESLEALNPEELLARIDAWVPAAGNALPAVSQLPWQAVVRAAVRAEDPARRRQAADALLQIGALDPVETLVAAQADPTVPDDVKASVAETLGQLSGVPFPPPGVQAETPEQAAQAWRLIWYATLSGQNDEAHVAYVWRELGRAMGDYLRAPDDQKAERLRGLRGAVLQTVAGPGSIPPGVSPAVRALTMPVLSSKQALGTALAVLQSADADNYARADAVSRVRQEAEKPHGPDVGMLFLEPLARVTAREENPMFATDLGYALWTITRIPLQLTEGSLQDRQQRVREWARLVEASRGVQLDLGLQAAEPPAEEGGS